MKIVDNLKDTLKNTHPQYFRDMEQDPFVALGLGIVVATGGALAVGATGVAIKLLQN